MKLRKFISILFALLLITNTNMVFAEDTGNTTATITFLPGTISLSEMSSISFGSHTITSGLNTFPATQSKVSLDVLDYRGTGQGWSVTAIASKFTDEDSDITLPGSTISLLNGTATTAQAGNTAAPTVSNNIQLDCDGTTSANIASAATNHGLGSWSIEWDGTAGNNTNATVSIPVPTTGTHTATITWTLTVGP